MSCHGPEADFVSAVVAEGLLCRVALRAIHIGHLTVGIFDAGCAIPCVLIRAHNLRKNQ